jgi:hypothetical protein
LPSSYVAGGGVLSGPRLPRNRAAGGSTKTGSPTRGTESKYYISLSERQIFRGGYGTARFYVMHRASARGCLPVPCLPVHGVSRGLPDGGWSRAGGGRDDARRTVVTGDAIAQPRPGRAPGDGSQLLSDVQRAAEIYRHVSVLPGNPISRIGDFLPDRPAVDPGSPEAIRSHFAKPFNRVLTQFALGIFGLLPAAGGAPNGRDGLCRGRGRRAGRPSSTWEAGSGKDMLDFRQPFTGCARLY